MEQETVIRLKYHSTKVRESRVDMTRFKGSFSGNCHQVLQSGIVEEPGKKPIVICDLKVEIGGKDDPLEIYAVIRSYFTLTEEIEGNLTEEEQAFCRGKGFEEGANAFSRLFRLHAGTGVKLSLPPPPAAAVTSKN